MCAPKYLCNLFPSCMQSTGYSWRSSNTSNLFVPKPNSKSLKRNIALPSNLKTVKNVDIFKNKFFEYLLLQNIIKYILVYHIKHVVCLCVCYECKLSGMKLYLTWIIILKEIQSCTNEDIRFHGVWALEVQNDHNNEKFKKEHILQNQLYRNNPSCPNISKDYTGEKSKRAWTIVLCRFNFMPEVYGF